MFLSHEFGDLHIGAVKRSQGNGAVHHKLHIAGTGSLHARRRDLFADLRRRIDKLRIGHGKDFHECHTDPVVYGRIVVDHVRHGVHQPDHVLGKGIPLRRLP